MNQTGPRNPLGLVQPGPVSWWPLTFLLVLGALLRIIRLGSDLWLDEIGTLDAYLRSPLRVIIRTYISSNQHLLYSILARISVDLFGESAWSIRLPAVLFGIGGIAALYYTGRVMTREREALLAAAFLTVSYHHIWFSQDARGYSAMVFFSLLGTGFLLRAQLGSDSRFWVAYVAAMTLGSVALLNTFFVVLGQLCAVLAVWASKRATRTTLLPGTMLSCSGAIAILALLSHSLMLGQMIHYYRTVDRTGLGYSNLASFLPVVASGLRSGVGLAALLVLGALMFAGWLSYWRQTPLVAAILVLPGLLNIAALIFLHIGAYPRSFLYVLPFAFLIAVRGLTQACAKFRIERYATLVTAAMTVATILPLVAYYRYPKQDFSGALRFAREHMAPQDRIAAVDLAGSAYRRFYARDILFPKSVAELEALRPVGGHLWVLYSFPREMAIRAPEMSAYVRNQMHREAVLHGTLGDGDLFVARTR